MNDITTREDIKLMVNTFYTYLQKDKELNHLFNEVAKLNWEKHLPKMYDFWETILFHKPVFKGNPMKVHMDLDNKTKLKKENFDTWLVIFKKTVDELFVGELAELAKQRAASVALSIQLNTVYKK
ncbi:MAG: group III truncated hemoglobin [Flavobacteriaceae bacterium]